jgi:hypothetical protein
MSFQREEHTANTTPELPPAEEYATEEEATEYLNQYWAAEKDPSTFWTTLCDKEQEFFDAFARRGLFNMTRLSFSQYFGTTNSMGITGQWQTQSISFGGENQELIELTVNEYRSFCDQIFNMACKNRPAFQAQAVNTDYKSLAQIEASDTMVSYFYDDVFGERKEREVVKIEGLYGKSYTELSWDEDDGEVIEYDEQIPSELGPITVKQNGRAGKLRIDRRYPWEVVCEPYRSEHDEHLWRSVIRPKRSKVEYQARFPLYAKQIANSTLIPSLYEYSVPGSDPMQQEAEGLCAVRVFYHARTMAMPEGRYVVYVNDVQVEDKELPIDVIPVIPFMSCELHGTSFGISDLWNLIPLEQISNQVLSDVATNLEAFGRPSLALVEGSDIDIDALANGQKIVFVPPGKDSQPTPIKFPEMPAFSLKAIELFRQYKQSLSGLNAIARGDTSTNITSGAHAALYSQIAVEAQSERSLNLDLHRERIGNCIIAYLKRYAKHPQLVAVAGVDERSYLQYFTEKDWDGIQRVKIKTANPMLKTQAGRLQLVDLLKDWPGMPLKDPQQIIELIVSGQLKPLYSTTRAAEMRIRSENEELMKGPTIEQLPGTPDPMTGQPIMKQVVSTVPVFATDNATSHLFGHLDGLNSPAAMQDPKVRSAFLTHILDHIATARTGDPYLAQLLGNPPPQQAMQAGAQMPGQEKDSGGPTPAQVNKAEQTSKPPLEDDSKTTIPKPAEPPPNSAQLS